MKSEALEVIPSVAAQEELLELEEESFAIGEVGVSLDASQNDQSSLEPYRSSKPQLQSIRGLLQDQFGQALEGCSVALVIEGARASETRTGVDGRFTIEGESLANFLDSAKAILQVSALPADCMYNPKDAVEPRIDSINILRAWRGVSIRGTVINSDIRVGALHGTRIRAYCVAAHLSQEAAVDPDTGFFCLAPLIPGEWHVRAIGPLPHQVRSAASIVQAPLASIVIELPSPLSIDYALEGVATVKDGWAYVVSDGYSARKDRVGLNGQWILTPGKYDIQVSIINEEGKCFWGSLRNLVVEEPQSLVIALHAAASLDVRYGGGDPVTIGVMNNKVLLDSRMYFPGERATLVAPIGSNIEFYLTSNGETRLVHEEYVSSLGRDQGITVLIP